MKLCIKCNLKKDFTKFSIKTDSVDGYCSKCKDCHNKYVREVWYPKNKDKQKKSSSDYKQKFKYKILSKKYNIDESTLIYMIEKSNSKCDICKKSSINLHIDHDHKTGKVRGILCKNCNNALGFFEDNIVFMSSAILYLS